MVLLTPDVTSYTLEVPSQDDNTFRSVILYIVDKDKEVKLDNIYIRDDSINFVEPVEQEPSLDFIMKTYGLASRFYGEADTYLTFGGGFYNDNNNLQPFIFSEPGKITFDAALVRHKEGEPDNLANENNSPVDVYFKFEKNPYPDTEPSYYTNSVEISSYDLTSFSIDIPTQGTKIFTSFLLNLSKNGIPIKLSNLKVFHDNNQAPL